MLNVKNESFLLTKCNVFPQINVTNLTAETATEMLPKKKTTKYQPSITETVT